MARAAGRGGGEARFEAKGLAFHERLRAAFLAIAEAEPDRCVVIDAVARRGRGRRGDLERVKQPHRPRRDRSPAPSARGVRLRATRRSSGRSWTPLERGRLHHAWLLIGPEGVGKATFAYRAARRLLGARPEPSLGPLGDGAGRPGHPPGRWAAPIPTSWRWSATPRTARPGGAFRSTRRAACRSSSPSRPPPRPIGWRSSMRPTT